jgi:hypothetical protein
VRSARSVRRNGPPLTSRRWSFRGSITAERELGGKGIVVNEPLIVAINKNNGNIIIDVRIGGVTEGGLRENAVHLTGRMRGRRTQASRLFAGAKRISRQG